MESGAIGARWRAAAESEDSEIIEMCAELFREDPGQKPVPRDHMRRTLQALRAHPVRGRVVVAEADKSLVGYALLVSIWSNEYGGELCTVDELYVKPAARGKGISKNLFRLLADQDPLWPGQPVGLALEVTPRNTKARKLYEGLGFAAIRNQLMRKVF